MVANWGFFLQGASVSFFFQSSLRIIVRVISVDRAEAITYFIEGGKRTQRKKRQNTCFKGRLCETPQSRVSHIFCRVSASLWSRLSILTGV